MEKDKDIVPGTRGGAKIRDIVIWDGAEGQKVLLSLLQLPCPTCHRSFTIRESSGITEQDLGITAGKVVKLWNYLRNKLRC